MVRIKSWLLATLLLLPLPAQAGLCGTFLDPMSVSGTTMGFGNYLPASASPSNSTITVSCGLGIDLLPSFTVALSAGRSGSMITRTMVFGTQSLNYNIYTTIGYGTVWGDGTGGSVTQSVNGSVLQLGNTNFTAFGLLPAGQYVAAGGPYLDTITVSVSF
jgi:spore coat protein U-like protein